MERAEEVRACLAAEVPSFVKFLLRSHVSGGFWLGLPKDFCEYYLPGCDSVVTLVDERGQEFETMYLVGRNGLSGGWRRFSIAHGLLQRDVLVFQLVNTFKLKVYIVREDSLTEVDGALGLMKLRHARGTYVVSAAEKYLNPLPLETHLKKIDKKSQKLSDTEVEYSENDSVYSSTISEETRNSQPQPVLEFNEVKSIKNFTISVNGLCIDSKLSGRLRARYYELCCSQKSYLHDHLLRGIDCGLAAELISETVQLADTFRDCKLSGSTRTEAEFATWHRTLRRLELLGMNVGFLCAWFDQLVSIAFESKEDIESTRYRKRIE